MADRSSTAIPTPQRLTPDPNRSCSVSECGRRAHARGLCNSHYLKERYKGVTEQSRAYARKYQREHRERATVLKREWTRRNREKLNARKAQRRREDYERVHAKETTYRLANRERINAGKRASYHRGPQKANRRFKKYDLTVEAFHLLVESQDGLCAICNEQAALEIDHDHQTHAIRGLLCGKCNRAIGLLEDDPKRLESAIVYLRGVNG